MIYFHAFIQTLSEIVEGYITKEKSNNESKNDKK